MTIHQIACRHPDMTQPGPIAQIGQALIVELEKLHKTQSTQSKGELADHQAIRELSQKVSASIPKKNQNSYGRRSRNLSV
jgi:hypothetical protein